MSSRRLASSGLMIPPTDTMGICPPTRLTTFVNIGMVIVIWSGGLQSIQGNLSIGQIVAFTNYLLTTMGPLTMMTMLSNTWANGFASAQRVNEVLDTVPEVEDAPDAQPLPGSIHGRIAFENVSFHYNGDSDAAVAQVEPDAEALPGDAG